MKGRLGSRPMIVSNHSQKTSREPCSYWRTWCEGLSFFHMFPKLTSYPNSHNYPDSKAVQIFGTIRLSNPAKILVIDRMVVPEFRKNVRDAFGTDENHVPLRSQKVPTMYDLVMASLPGGRTRTVEEWRSLFTKGGLKSTHLEHPLGKQFWRPSPFKKGISLQQQYIFRSRTKFLMTKSWTVHAQIYVKPLVSILKIRIPWLGGKRE